MVVTVYGPPRALTDLVKGCWTLSTPLHTTGLSLSVPLTFCFTSRIHHTQLPAAPGPLPMVFPLSDAPTARRSHRWVLHLDPFAQWP